jgi:hypothetical protein
MAAVTTGDAIKAALGGQLDDAAVVCHRLMNNVGDVADQVYRLRRAVDAIESDELTSPLSAAYQQLQEALLVLFMAWRRLER